MCAKGHTLSESNGQIQGIERLSKKFVNTRSRLCAQNIHIQSH